MKNVALDFNIILMTVAHCQINLASEGWPTLLNTYVFMLLT